MANETSTSATDGQAIHADAGAWGDFFKNLPASELKPLSGTTVLAEGAGYPGELVAYSLLDNVTDAIATKAEQLGVDHALLVEDRALLDSDWSHAAITSQIASLRARVAEAAALLTPEQEQHDQPQVEGSMSFAPLVIPTILQGIASIPKIVGDVADVVGMLRTNYTVASRTMSASGTPLVAQVAGLLRGKNVTVDIDGFSAIPSDSEVLSEFELLRSESQTLARASIDARARTAESEQSLSQLQEDRKATLASLLKVMESDKPGTILATRIEQLDTRICTERSTGARDKAIVAFVDGTLAEVATFELAALTPTAGQRSPLMAAVARESLHLESGGPSHVLFVSIDSVGAEAATPTSQIQNTDYVRYIGGMQASYLLYSLHERSVVGSGVKRALKQVTMSIKTGDIVVNAYDELG